MAHYTLTLTYDWNATPIQFPYGDGKKHPPAGHSLSPAYQGFDENDQATIEVVDNGGKPLLVNFVFRYEDPEDRKKWGESPFDPLHQVVQFPLYQSKDGKTWSPKGEAGFHEHLKNAPSGTTAKWMFHLELVVEQRDGNSSTVFIWDPELIVDPYTGGGG